jgi:hypothetical protein
MINGIFGIEKMSRPFRASLGGWSTQGAALVVIHMWRTHKSKPVFFKGR